MKDDAIGDDLVRRMRAGDVSAVAELYDRHAGAVYGLACRIVRNSADAEEVVQEAFLQVWQQAARFDSARATVAGWLLMITRTRALDRLRRMDTVHRRNEGLARVEDLRAGAAWAADHVLMTEENGRGLRQAFEALPAMQRVAVELAFYEGLTHSEIADVLCQPLGTIKTRIRLGVHRMRGGLKGDAGEGTAPSHEASPFAVALADYLARRPLLTTTYRDLRGRLILVVDDDAEAVDLVATLLQSAGATVMTARSTLDGLARLRDAWPAVLLADIAMPQDDGYSLIRQARVLADASGQRLTAVAFTAYGGREQEKVLRAGFETLISKPVQPHALLDIVSRLASSAA